MTYADALRSLRALVEAEPELATNVHFCQSQDSYCAQGLWFRAIGHDADRRTSGPRRSLGAVCDDAHAVFGTTFTTLLHVNDGVDTRYRHPNAKRRVLAYLDDEIARERLESR